MVKNQFADAARVLVDVRSLAGLRYPDGIVREGMRDLYGHLGACQLAGRAHPVL